MINDHDFKQTVQTISFYLWCVFVIDKNIYILTYHVEAQTHIIYLCEQIVACLIPPSLCYCQTENEYHIFENVDLRAYNKTVYSRQYRYVRLILEVCICLWYLIPFINVMHYSMVSWSLNVLVLLNICKTTCLMIILISAFSTFTLHFGFAYLIFISSSLTSLLSQLSLKSKWLILLSVLIGVIQKYYVCIENRKL